MIEASLKVLGWTKFLSRVNASFPTAVRIASFNCLFNTHSSGVDPEVQAVDIFCGTINIEALKFRVHNSFYYIRFINKITTPVIIIFIQEKS